MADDSDNEKTEEPTGKRLEQAREQGQVPHSRELATFLVLIAAAMSFWFLGAGFVRGMQLLVKHGLTWSRPVSVEPQLALTRLTELASEAIFLFWPLALTLIIAALASPFFLNAWNFSSQAFMPKFDRLDPVNGIQRVFSWNGVVELLKAVLKTLVIGGVAAMVIWSERGQVFGLVSQPLEEGLTETGHLLSWSFLAFVASMLILVAADVPFQLWQYYDKMKMSREEVRQESKESEGDPHVKARIRGLQREAARRRMMSAVPKADVIVTNPTHFAVALSYKSGMRAPKLVAKGTGAVALKIRELGAEHGVPLLEAPPLARTLHKHVELDQEIPATLYTAVAEVLAYVFQLNRYRQVGGDLPMPPKDLPVPSDMVPEAVGA